MIICFYFIVFKLFTKSPDFYALAFSCLHVACWIFAVVFLLVCIRVQYCVDYLKAVKHEKSLKKLVWIWSLPRRGSITKNEVLFVHLWGKGNKLLNPGNLGHHNTIPPPPPSHSFFFREERKSLELVCTMYRNTENLQGVIVDEFDRLYIQIYFDTWIMWLHLYLKC